MGAASGAEVLYHNPAHLGFTDRPPTSAMVGVSASGLSQGVEIADLFRGDEQRNAELLASIPDSGVRIELGLGRLPFDTGWKLWGQPIVIPSQAVQWGPVAFGYSSHYVGEQVLSREFVDLLLNGSDAAPPADGTSRETHGTWVRYLDFSAAYGRRVGPVYVGATGHYIRGRDISRIRVSAPEFDLTGFGSVDVEVLQVYENLGTGFVLDLGAAWRPSQRLTLSGAIVGLVSTLSWANDLRVRDFHLTNEDFGGGVDGANPFQQFAQSDRPFGASESAEVRAMAEGLYDGMEVPMSLRLGGALRPWSGATVAWDLEQRLRDGYMGGHGWDRALALGAEQRVWFVGVRGGAATDLGGNFLVSAGVDLGGLYVSLGRRSGTGHAVPRNGWIAAVEYTQVFRRIL